MYKLLYLNQEETPGALAIPSIVSFMEQIDSSLGIGYAAIDLNNTAFNV